MADNKVVSGRTWGVVAFGVVASAFSLALLNAGIEGSTLVKGLIGNFGSIVTTAFAAGVIIWAALRFGPAESLRRQWLLIGLGACSYLLGTLIWTYYEAFLGVEVPFPGAPDIGYLLVFPFIAAGLILAIRSFTSLLSVRVPLIFAGVATLIATVALWVPVLQPLFADTESSGLAKTLGLLYPLADLWLLFFPALALAVMLSKLSGGRLAWPWWAVVVGCVLFVFGDTMFMVTTNAGTYASGGPLDLTWWLGYTALAVGASLMVDIQKPKRAGGEQS
jgi:hypothetical protein